MVSPSTPSSSAPSRHCYGAASMASTRPALPPNGQTRRTKRAASPTGERRGRGLGRGLPRQRSPQRARGRI
jgi:hypothetical protein